MPAVLPPTNEWILTHSGIQYKICSPVPENINLRDIAHALSNICRFGGHTRGFYSVGQHSIHCTQYILSRKDIPNRYIVALKTLLHDATEAYMGDMVRPLKHTPHMRYYRKLEKCTEVAVFAALGIPLITSKEKGYITEADNVLLMTERRDVMNHGNIEWKGFEAFKPWKGISIVPTNPVTVEAQFISLFDRLTAYQDGDPDFYC